MSCGGRSCGGLSQLPAALAPHGLLLRGGFHPEPGEAGLAGAATVPDVAVYNVATLADLSTVATTTTLTGAAR